MNPKVSVVIPVYNSAKYLKECLNSIFVQTLEDWEVIAVNDGSSDESPTILDAYAKRDSRFQVVHKENGGVSAARNDGLSVARGEYVFFMDSDDILDKDAFHNLYGIAVAENADIVMGDHWAFQESEIGTDEEKRYVFFNENFITQSRECIEQLQQTILYRGFSPYYSSRSGYLFSAPWTKLFKRYLLQKNKIQFPTTISLFEDGVFGILALEFAQKVCYAQIPVMHYRVLKTSLCHNQQFSSESIYKKIDKEICQIEERFHKSATFQAARDSRFLFWTKKQAGLIFSCDLSFFKKYRELVRLLKNPFFKNFIDKVPQLKLNKNERLFGNLAYYKLYLILAIILQIRRG